MSDSHYSKSPDDTEREADPGDLFMAAADADAPAADDDDALDRFTAPCWNNLTDTSDCYRLLKSAGPDLVIAMPSVTGKGGAYRDSHAAVIYAVDPNRGMLSQTHAVWHLINAGRDYMAGLAYPALGGRELGACAKAARKLLNSRRIASLSEQMPAVLLDAAAHDVELDAQVVDLDAIDRNLGYVGTTVGVLELHTGRILSPEEARPLLIASSIPDPYNPAARHPWVDDILPPLPRIIPAEDGSPDPWALYRAQAVAYAMRNPPRRQLFLEQCDAGSGKTTFTNALGRGFGDAYITVIRPDVLLAPPKKNGRSLAGTGGGAHNGDLRHFMAPTRVVFTQEFESDPDVPLLKRLSGGDEVPYRRIREEDTKGRPTAHLWIQGNEASGNYDLSGNDSSSDAMRDRVRLLYRQRREDLGLPVDDRVEDYGNDDTELEPGDALLFRQAVVARVVEYCQWFADAGFPESLVAQRELLEQRADAEMEPHERWIRSVVKPQPGGSFTAEDLLAAYNEWVPADAQRFSDTKELMAAVKSTMGRKFPKTGERRMRNGVRATAYRGWIIAEMPPEPPENAATAAAAAESDIESKTGYSAGENADPSGSSGSSGSRCPNGHALDTLSKSAKCWKCGARLEVE